ncbi:hypothetical protein [Marinobacter sp. ATCH36]|uniref:hypothetical protein n=1 Tax=Marinobacter sp. ATCH36 TaxID=2945106 RepID=UPI00202292C4|nr:hypothetical protein [Marinobacter sp. ATCH36]MCL7944775.1 hypothetical protein [Marinobacter sp. ATCH36]
MPWMTPKTISQLILSALFVFSGLTLAGKADPDDYIGSKQLVLEVRYCECEAASLDGSPSDLLTAFLEESSILKVAVSPEDKGFVSTHEISVGYEFNRVKDSSGKFEFSYAGTYTTRNGNSSGQGQLLLEKGQWVNLFGYRHESENESLHTDVAVRLVKSGGS